MSWTKRVSNPSKLLKVGDTDRGRHRPTSTRRHGVSRSSLRATEPNPWEQLAEKYRIGDRVDGTVRNLTDFGAFVEIEEGIDGLVHVSDMSWGRRVKHPSEVLKKGDQIQAVLTALDVELRGISLSIKEFRPNEWEQFAGDHQPGDSSRAPWQRLPISAFSSAARRARGTDACIGDRRSPRREVRHSAQEGDAVRVRVLGSRSRSSGSGFHRAASTSRRPAPTQMPRLPTVKRPRTNTFTRTRNRPSSGAVRETSGGPPDEALHRRGEGVSPASAARSSCCSSRRPFS